MDAALLITQPFTESGGEAMFVAGFFPSFSLFFLFQIHRLWRRGNVPCFRKFFIFRCASIFWIHAGESLSLLLSDSCYLLLQFFLIFSFFFSYRFPDWVLLDGVQWISLSIWCCVMNECRLLHENPFTTGKWYYYQKWGWFCAHFIYTPNKDSSKNVWYAILSSFWKGLHSYTEIQNVLY